MTTATVDPASFEYVRQLVRQHSAIALEPNKGYLVDSRLTPLAKQFGHASLTEWVSELRSKPFGSNHTRLIEAMTTNETSFFRDLHPFEALRDQILPEIIRKRAAQRTLNIWSAACSTGQEPYTIAISLREHFPQLASWNVRILATDLSTAALEKAKEGVYSQAEINRGLPAALLVKYFQRNGLHWKLQPELKRGIDFQRLNLIESWPTFPMMDIVFLRNVLIYFTPDVKRTILGNVRKRMTPDGMLLLGGAETTIGLDDSFVRMNLGKGAAYRLKS
jgi:chemotaxis protein methyltransferase CheR